MNTNRRKAGFTLVELMVVAIIVAILAAVAIPLMSGNKNRAAATEAQAACSTIKTGIRMMEVEGKSFPSSVTAVQGINPGDLEGNYFDEEDYTIASGTSFSNYVLRANQTAAKSDGIIGDVTMTNVNNVITWGGSLLQ